MRCVNRMLHGRLFGLLNASRDAADGLLRIVEPLGRPDAVNAPPHALQDQLAKEIADGKVDSVAARACLYVHREADGPPELSERPPQTR